MWSPKRNKIRISGFHNPTMKSTCLFEPAEREHGARPFGENEHANKAQLKVIWIRNPIPNLFLTIMIWCLKYGAQNQLGGKIIINIDANRASKMRSRSLQNEVREGGPTVNFFRSGSGGSRRAIFCDCCLHFGCQN